MAFMSRPALSLVMLFSIAALVALPTWQTWRQTPPDFSLYPAGEARKTAFFDFLGPLIEAENARWRADRERLQALAAEPPESWGKRDRLWVEDRLAFFEIDPDLLHAERLTQLLVHVDTVPKSLALAQAAKESAWGTSRFSVDGHNYFGQRCYEKGCGLVPAARSPGAKFEVRTFESPRASVASYFNNINYHREYEALRSYRAEERRLGRKPSGIFAAERLTQYSERRQKYVDEIQSLIHFNHLEKRP